MDKAHAETDRIIAEIEARYKKMYADNRGKLDKTISEHFKKFNRQDAKWQKLVEKGKRTEAEHKKWRRAHLATGEQYKAMRKKIAEQIYDVNSLAADYANDRLSQVYTVNYNAVEAQANAIKGYTFDLVNEDVVNSLADTDANFLPYKKINKKIDVAWNMRNVNNQVMVGIGRGESIPAITARILSVEQMNLNAAIRTARTICTSAENKARQDSYEKMEQDGVIMKKRWIATHDARTRDWHAELDGQMVDVNESFYNQMGEIKYPGDPSAKPANVYQCRCGLAAKVIGFERAKK